MTATPGSARSGKEGEDREQAAAEVGRADPPPQSRRPGSARERWELAALTAVAVLATSAAVFLVGQAGKFADQGSGPAGVTIRDVQDPSGFRGALAPPLLRLPDLALQSSHGGTWNPVQDSTAAVTVYFTGYTDCPDVCPATLAGVAAALRAAGPAVADQVQVVLVTTDPGTDTPAALSRYLGQFDDRWIGLTGAPADLLTMSRALGLPDPSRDGEVHTPQLTAFNGTGKPVLAWPEGVATSDLQHDLSKLITEGSPQ